MPMRNEFFSAYTSCRIGPGDTLLPLHADARADLLALLSEEDDYIYLSLVNDVGMETVKVKNDHGTLLMERGVEGTTDGTHPPATCVHAVSPTVVAIIKDLVCNYECCEPPCPAEPVQYLGELLPPAKVGEPWEGNIIFSNAQSAGVYDTPKWMNAKLLPGSGAIMLSGTPELDNVGEHVFTVYASNANNTAGHSAIVRVVE